MTKPVKSGKSRKAAAVPGLASLVAMLLAAPAYGAGHSGGHGHGRGHGSLGPGGVGVGIGVGGLTTTVPGGTVPVATVPVATVPVATVPSAGATTTPPTQGTWTFVPCGDCSAWGLACLPDGEMVNIPASPSLPPGYLEPLMAFWYDGATNQGLGEWACPLAAPTPPPPPPTSGQIWESEALPVPRVDVDPATYGIAQLPTWFWLGDDSVARDLVLPTVSLDGYSITGSVHPVAFRWAFGDGTGELSHTPGSPGGDATASAAHTYSEPGTYQVSVTVSWAGSYTFSGYGTTQTVPLGPVAQAPYTFPFVVQQVRSLLSNG